jgi:hypothetical protein
MVTVTTDTHFGTSLPFYLLLILLSRSPQTHTLGPHYRPTCYLFYGHGHHRHTLGPHYRSTCYLFYGHDPYRHTVRALTTVLLFTYFMVTIKIGTQFRSSLLTTGIFLCSTISDTFLRHSHSQNNVFLLHCTSPDKIGPCNMYTVVCQGGRE